MVAVLLPATAAAKTGIGQARKFAPRQLVVKFEGERRGHAIGLPAGTSVQRAAAALRDNRRVVYAEPNYLAHASAVRNTGSTFEIPNDTGSLNESGETGVAGGWAFKQWNFLPWQSGGAVRLISPGGIDATAAWQRLEEVGRPGAQGVRVAVLDSGIAYRNRGSNFRRSPDFAPGQFLKGYDFVGHDRLPLDENGHGTHVAGTIAEKTGNGIGLTGLAYGAKLIPVRVLNRKGVGNAAIIAKGIRFAIAHRAQVINMSFNFDCGQKVPIVDEALREAYAHGIVAVASAGNLLSGSRNGRPIKNCVSEPATGPRVIAVGGTTEGGCLGDYSLSGTAIDVVAPGGGQPIGDCPSVLSPADLPGDAEIAVDRRIHDPERLHRDLDGGRARLRRRRDGPRQRRPRQAEEEAEGAGQGGDPPPAQDRARHRPARDAAGRRPDRRRRAPPPRTDVEPSGGADDDHASRERGARRCWGRCRAGSGGRRSSPCCRRRSGRRRSLRRR